MKCLMLISSKHIYNTVLIIWWVKMLSKQDCTLYRRKSSTYFYFFLFIQKINAKLHDGVCQHCKGILEWRVKFRKYKLLTKPKKWWVKVLFINCCSCSLWAFGKYSGFGNSQKKLLLCNIFQIWSLQWLYRQC